MGNQSFQRAHLMEIYKRAGKGLQCHKADSGCSCWQDPRESLFFGSVSGIPSLKANTQCHMGQPAAAWGRLCQRALSNLDTGPCWVPSLNLEDLTAFDNNPEWSASVFETCFHLFDYSHCSSEFADLGSHSKMMVSSFGKSCLIFKILCSGHRDDCTWQLYEYLWGVLKMLARTLSTVQMSSILYTL